MPGCRKMYFPANRPFRPFRCILPCVFLFWAVFSSASAYVLKGEHVLQLMMDKNSLPERMRVSQTISFFDPDVDFMAADYDEKVFYQIPDKYRTEIMAENFQRIQVAVSGLLLTILDGKVVSESASWTDQYKELFSFRDRRFLAERLAALGINFSVTSLGRYQGMICYVLGADYPDETVPQLWVDKKTFRPVRWIVSPGHQAAGKRREILFHDWRNHYRTWYPGRIEFLENQRPVQRILVSQVETNPSFSADLFDVDRMKMIYGQRVPEEMPPEAQDISHQIEEFKKIYE